MFLFETIENAKQFGAYKDMPNYINNNLNPQFAIRPYQSSAFQNFITYYENEKLRQKPTQTLFHMATGSGKTLIMAGLIIYLYKQGYRNFLFFVNLDNIVKKTKDNFLNSASSKYLFADDISIDGEQVKIKEVGNFQYNDNHSINICFTTTQGLHSDMWNVKENSMSIEDFTEEKIVLISDEAHHLNADTRKGKKGSEDNDTKSWEYTVNRIFGTNNENILLEFTATCDLENPLIKASYENKIIFDYPLKKFREDKYSKEVDTLASDIPLIDRALQAIILSQYRLKVFQDNRLNIKPVVLFKAAKIADSKDFMTLFNEKISSLTGDVINKISGQSNEPILTDMYKYFENNNITFDRLAQELKEEFSAEHCISVNDDTEAKKTQISVNTLEDKDNPYRAIFEVKKLDEGWDVLNLFDIVRLYETRDSKNNKPGKTTIAEAQLIGRGARYCPFVIDEEENKYKRKFDDDLENPLRICEELFYHCQYDSRYISELKTALIETGIMAGDTTKVTYKLKEDFKQGDIYKNGVVFTNKRELKSRNEIYTLLPSVREKEYNVSMHSGKTSVDVLLGNESKVSDVKTYFHKTNIREISQINYSAVHKAVRRVDVYKFKTLKNYFPNLKSTKEFIMSKDYLGDIKLVIESREKNLTQDIYFEACLNVVTKIGQTITAERAKRVINGYGDKDGMDGDFSFYTTT